MTEPALPHHLEPIRPLGRGGQSRALLVWDRRREEQVVATSLPIDGIDPDALNRFHEVATVRRSARAECIAPISDVIEQRDACWLVGEYFAGGDLARYLEARRDRALPVVDALSIAGRVARALAHTHACGFVHGDVKPANLLLDEAGEAFLGDFGLARRAADPVADPGVAGGAPTAFGSVDYMAPELQSAAPISAATDLYALGCLLFELLSGRTPFGADDPAETLRRHQLAEPAPLRSLVPDAPRALAALVDRLLAKRAGERPQRAADVRVSLDAIRDGTSAFDDVARPSVARSGELRRIAELARSVAAGGSECVRIRAPAGLGKSRLLETLRAESERAGIVCLLAAADEQAQRPHGVLADLVRPLAAWLDDVEPRDADVLRRLFDAPDGGEPGVGPGHRDEILRALVGALRRWSARQPLALLLDDRQWADPDSASTLNGLSTAIARGAAELSGVLVGSAFRTGSGDDVSAWEKLPHFHDIALEPFGETEIFEFLTARGAPRPTAQLVRLVTDASDGIPLLAELVVERLQRGGQIVPDGSRSGVDTSLDALELQATLSESVAAALARLSADARQHIELAACVSRRFATERVARISGKRAGLEERLLEARRAGLLQPAAGGHQFRHPLVWRAVYDGIEPVRRERLHQKIAVWAMNQSESELPERPFLVAHHLLRSGSRATVDELFRWTREAGEQAFRRLAWREAADLYEGAIRLLGSRDDLPAGALAELHARAGASHYLGYDAGPAIRHLQQAVDGLRGVDDLQYARALNDLIRVNGQSGATGYGEFGPLVPELEAAVRRLGPHDEALRARVFVTLAEAHWTAGNAHEALQFSRNAIELATRIGDERICGESHVLIAIAKLQACELSDALASLRTAIAHARRHDDGYVMRFAKSRIPLPLLGSGRVREAREAIRECLALDDLVVNSGDATMSHALLAYSSIASGRYEEADAEAERALELIRRVEFPWPRLVLHPAMAYSRMVRRDFGRAVELVREYAQPGIVFADPAPLLPTTRRFAALIGYYAGDPLGLRADDLGADLLPEGDVDAPGAALDLLDLIHVGLHAELCDASGAPADPRAERILDRAEQRGAVLSIAWPFLLPRARGTIALGNGRVEDAIAHFERAIGIAEGVGSEYEVARSRYEHARALALQGARLSALRALDQVERARPVLAEKGPVVVAEKCERLAQFLAERSR